MTVKEIILYFIFGVTTTIINFLSYILFDNLLQNTAVSTVISWIIAVLFAFITNKLLVFGSADISLKKILPEAASFFSVRIMSGLLDLGIMVLGVDILLYNKVLVKILSNVIVIIINYVASKVIFKK